MPSSINFSSLISNPVTYKVLLLAFLIVIGGILFVELAPNASAAEAALCQSDYCAGRVAGEKCGKWAAPGQICLHNCCPVGFAECISGDVWAPYWECNGNGSCVKGTSFPGDYTEDTCTSWEDEGNDPNDCAECAVAVGGDPVITSIVASCNASNEPIVDLGWSVPAEITPWSWSMPHFCEGSGCATETSNGGNVMYPATTYTHEIYLSAPLKESTAYMYRIQVLSFTPVLGNYWSPTWVEITTPACTAIGCTAPSECPAADKICRADIGTCTTCVPGTPGTWGPCIAATGFFCPGNEICELDGVTGDGTCVDCSGPLPPPPPPGPGDTGGGVISFENPLETDLLKDLLDRVLDILIIFGGSLYVLMILIAAFIYTTSGANPQKRVTAKNILIFSTIGFFILITGRVILFAITSFVL